MAGFCSANRRRLLVGAAAWPALAWTGTARAQAPARVARIGLLSPFSPADTALWHQAFRQGLRDLGWIEGKNIGIEYRYAESKSNILPDLAADLVRLRVDIIVVDTISPALAAKNTTRTIPIVVAAGSDTVVSGLIESLARPGGNVTGLEQMAPGLGGKRLELLKEIVPKLSRVAVLWNPKNAGSTLNWKELQVPARQLGVQLHSLEVSSLTGFDKAFDDAARVHAGALAVMPDPVFVTNLKRIADLAVRSRLPSIFHLREFVDAGGLVAYGPDRADLFRRAATYVDKILKGTKPADLPVEQPTKFELVVNVKTAKALGLTVPQAFLMRADRVIE
jgi:putative ABC transport system substrate-binding protein